MYRTDGSSRGGVVFSAFLRSFLTALSSGISSGCSSGFLMNGTRKSFSISGAVGSNGLPYAKYDGAAAPPGWLVFLEDVGYFAACAVTTFGFLVSANYGEIRAFALLGEALGALLCALTLSQLLMACSRTIIAAVRAVWNVIFRLFLRPCYRVCRWMAGIIVGCVHGCGVKVKKSFHLANFGLKQRRILLYNLIKSRRRDPPASGSPPEGEENGN